VVNLAARQVRRQRLALGLLFVVLALWRRRCLLDLGGQGGQIGVNGFLEQALLFGVEGLGLGRELQPLEHRHLVSEFVDGGLLESYVGDQGAHHLAQLRHLQVLKLCFVDHER
jgi:hypothetical protein